MKANQSPVRKEMGVAGDLQSSLPQKQGCD